MYIVLMYDIKMDDKGVKIRKKVFDLCKKYLYHIQFSVFEGQIDKSELFLIKQTLKKLIRDDKDNVIIFESIFDTVMTKNIIGLQEDKTTNFL